MFHDKTGAYSYDNVGDLLNHPNQDEVYVYSKSNGRAVIDGNYFSADYDHEVYTWQLNSDLYFAFYIVVDGEYHYVNFRCTNIKALAAERAVSTSTTYKEDEKLVYGDMVALYDAVKAYRDDYFARNPQN